MLVICGNFTAMKHILEVLLGTQKMIFQISDININLKFFVGVTKANEKPWEQYFPQEQFSQHKQHI